MLVWLNVCIGFRNLRCLKALQYRTFRIAKKDHRRRQTRESLDDLGRARTSTWAKYAILNLGIKTINSGCPLTSQMN